jgi:hypothetical protein
MKKKVFTVVLVFLLIAGTLSAKEITTGSNEATLDLSFVYKAVNLIVGAFAGCYVLIKAAFDIFHAVRNSSEDPNGLKKAIGGLVLNIAILSSFMFIVNYVFGSFAKDISMESATAQEAFFAALTGVEVSIQ